jgi:hypothetical protein
VTSLYEDALAEIAALRAQVQALTDENAGLAREALQLAGERVFIKGGDIPNTIESARLALIERAEQAEAQVQALTASKAAITEERDKWRNQRHAFEAELFARLQSALDHPDDKTVPEMIEMLIEHRDHLVGRHQPLQIIAVLRLERAEKAEAALIERTAERDRLKTEQDRLRERDAKLTREMVTLMDASRATADGRLAAERLAAEREAENTRLREALTAIAECRSRFSLDPLERAVNAAQHCMKTAKAALSPTPAAGEEPTT